MGKNNYKVGKVANGKCLLCAEPVSIFTKTVGLDACICEECNSYAISIEKNRIDLKEPVLGENNDPQLEPQIAYKNLERKSTYSWEQKMEKFYFSAG